MAAAAAAAAEDRWTLIRTPEADAFISGLVRRLDALEVENRDKGRSIALLRSDGATMAENIVRLRESDARKTESIRHLTDVLARVRSELDGKVHENSHLRDHIQRILGEKDTTDATLERVRAELENALVRLNASRGAGASSRMMTAMASLSVLREALCSLCGRLWTEKPMRVIAEHILELVGTGAVPLLVVDAAAAWVLTDEKKQARHHVVGLLADMSADDLSTKKTFGIDFKRDCSTHKYRDDLTSMVLTIVDAVLACGNDVVMTHSLRSAINGLGAAAPVVLAMFGEGEGSSSSAGDEGAPLFASVDILLNQEEKRRREVGFIMDQRMHVINLARLVLTVRKCWSAWAQRQSAWSNIAVAAVVRNGAHCPTIGHYAHARKLDLVAPKAAAAAACS